MKKLFRSLVLLGCAAGLASCSLVYQPVKNEGTIILQSQVEQVKVGHTKDQVLYLLGSPTQYSPDSDTWYYIQRTVDQRNHATTKTYFVTFRNNKVSAQGYLAKDKK